MLTWSVTLVFLVWACIPSAAHPPHFPPPRPFPSRPPTASGIELQRVGARPPVVSVGGRGNRFSHQTAERSGDYSDAIYAANLAKELTRLEENKKSIYVDFISSLYMNPNTPGGFPPDLQRLSRGASKPSHGPHKIVSHTTTSFGPPRVIHPGHPIPLGRR